MGLSHELISQFAKVTNDNPSTTKKESSVYGTVVVDENNAEFVRLDGAAEDQLIPITNCTVAVANKDRVIVSIRNHSAVVTGNLTTPSTTVTYVNEVKTIITKEVKADVIEAAEAKIENLEAYDAEVKGTLTTHNAKIEGKLDAKAAEITYAKIEQVDANYGEFNTLKSDYAAFKEATVNDLYADVAEIETLIFGSAGGKVIQTSFANAVIAQLGSAQIKSAMIDEVLANKIKSGDIITNNVRIKSEDGSLLISDETIQISDSARVRVQIGKDASNDYSINIWDAEGKLMFSQGGITDAAIKNAIIRNDMVADNANISASKLDISSLFTEINADGTNTIKSSKVYLDDKKSTLDVEFKALSDDVSSHGTSISALEDAIRTKVWEQDIDDATDELNTKYTALEQDVDSITTTVSEHTAEITDAGSRLSVTQSVVEQLVDSMSTLVTDSKGSSLMTQTSTGWTFSTSEIQNTIDDMSEGLDSLVKQCNNTDVAVEVLQQAVKDLGTTAEYIKIGTYEDEPCIMLGESDSDFKLLITNTKILFMDGSDVPAYITNKSLYIKKAIIEEELRQGGYAWVTRSNGHLSLIWKGVDE